MPDIDYYYTIICQSSGKDALLKKFYHEDGAGDHGGLWPLVTHAQDFHCF